MPLLDSSPAATNPYSRTSTNGTVKAASPEFALLVACCSLGPRELRQTEIVRLCESPLDWARVLELGEHHGVLPIVHQALRDTADQVPSNILAELSALYEENVRKNLRFTAELFQILDCLEAAGIAAIPYKGPVLAQTIYGDLALRDFSDLDVLIQREEVPRAREALSGLGYTPASQFSPAEERSYLATGYEYTFDGPAGANLLEIQWDIVPRFYAVDFPMRDLFARAVSIGLAGRIVKTLAPEDLLLALCVHAAKHGWIRLCWLRDIAGVATSQALDWTILARRAGDLGVRRIVSVSLSLAQQLLAADLPRRFEDGPSITRLCSEVIARLPSAEEFGTESAEYFRLMLRLRERNRDQMRFVTRLAFTPGPGEWELVRLPASLFPLYRVLRLCRLANRLARMSLGGSR